MHMCVVVWMGNAHHPFLHLDIGSQLKVLFGEVIEILDVYALLEDRFHWG